MPHTLTRHLAGWSLLPTGGLMAEDVPRVVQPGWHRAAFIKNLGGPSYRLLFYSDTKVRFEHRCDRGPRGVIVCAPALTNVGQPGGHQVGTGPTVNPSILCSDCGTHGFITDGKWVGC
jgi:hypothetical protein